MEVTLAASLVSGALLCHARGLAFASAALLGLAVLARPEASLLVPLVVLAGPLSLRRTGLIIGVVAVLTAPWVAFNLRTAGAALPATATAKVEGGLVAFLRGSHEPLAWALIQRPLEFEGEWVSMLWTINAVATVLLLPGLWVLWRRRGRRDGLPALILLLHPLGMALLAPYRGPAFQEARYSIHLLPLAAAIATLALHLGGSRGRDRGRSGALDAFRARGVSAVAGTALLAAGLLALWPAAGRYAWAVQNIEAMQVSLGRWVDEQTPRGARLALNDVGAIAYLSRRPVVDVMGLVTPAILPYRREGDAGVLRFLEQACPDYLIVFPAWFPVLSARGDRFTPIHRVRLDRNTVAGADEMVVYETVWNRWRQGPRPCG
jgi:hypothetical protein